MANISKVAKINKENELVIKVNNELNETSLPCGMTIVQKSKQKLGLPYFDFFNYSGIHRSVWLMETAEEMITDYNLTYELKDHSALINYEIITNGKSDVAVQLDLR